MAQPFLRRLVGRDERGGEEDIFPPPLLHPTTNRRGKVWATRLGEIQGGGGGYMAACRICPHILEFVLRLHFGASAETSNFATIQDVGLALFPALLQATKAGRGGLGTRLT